MMLGALGARSTCSCAPLISSCIGVKSGPLSLGTCLMIDRLFFMPVTRAEGVS